MREDEIQILGRPQKKRFGNRMWWAITAVVLLLMVIGLSCYFADGNRRRAVLEKVEADVNPLSVLQAQGNGLYAFDTEMNDIHISTLHLINMNSQLTLAVPTYNDTTMLLAAVATRERPVGSDLVIDGKLMARGCPMKGFCAIVNGNVAIGETTDDDVMNYCIDHGGSFFRQNMVVKEGKVIDAPLKGKASRCALARQGNDMYIVYTEDEESVHDFAEAMVDIGVLDALLLDEDVSTLHFKLREESRIYGPEVLPSLKKKTVSLIFKLR